ncbi:MAG: SIS domain-containing protein [Candidatus Aminicenantes bacterium]|nr:SIS domain-containing protein [Candidatus Aminicenantes bacterium]
MEFIETYLQEVREIAAGLDRGRIADMVRVLKGVRDSGGRLFFLGVGGSAANASHAVNDFRKLCGFEAYSPLDNVSELSARINDDGWESVFVKWLSQSKLRSEDGVFVLSVGGGSLEKNISVNLVKALEFAKEKGAKILGIVGRDGGYTAGCADACVIVPSVNHRSVTAHAEAFQAVVWHLLAGHPDLKACEMKWESVK